ncbi:hypothetical protein [Mycolicibacterium mucogenicum]|uniref:Uncharacterized protein n=2 Tax=Mycolicibacterium mucogenicum DSM 44124 TaxID=1226753 RepID=A0A8E4R418_MYCMU|nr:hypothetical protein [Mycolicibacterium mucogenicum]QPG67127.1 hypothetical protein C1S78_016165 [Mycolicibacterium mucogenicum DSM 44124]
MAGADAAEFLEGVSQGGLTHLLGLPLHADNLLKDWRQSHQLPASRSMAMQHAVNRMLTEMNTARPPVGVDDHRRLLIAERLAALSMFCGAGSYAPSTLPVNDRGMRSPHLAASSVPTEGEPDLAGSPLSVTDIREVLGTALFAAAGQGTVSFMHQSYAEFLAAQYLARRGVTGRRLISILGADVNGLVPGSMIEVLGWLLASNTAVPGLLISNNATQLLNTTGLEVVGDEVRRRIVDAILDGAADGLIDEGWRADTSGLAHASLATQLRDAGKCASNHWVSFWICRIARQCSVFEAADDLLSVALNPTCPYAIRREAVRAFAEVAPPARMSELLPLLNLDSSEDPFDEIHAATLRAVLSGSIDFDRIRGSIRPKRTSNYVGAYDFLLTELPTLLPIDGVVPTLVDAYAKRGDRSDHTFDDLLAGLVRRAWESKDPAVAEVIGATLSSDRLGFPRSFRDQGVPWYVDDDPDLRRAMAATALVTDAHAAAAVYDLRMLTPADLIWLIDWIGNAAANVPEAAQIVLRHLAWHVADAATAEYVFEIDDDHPAYQELKAFQGYRTLDSRPQWVTRDIEYAKSRPSVPEQAAKLRDAIDRARTDINDWWRVVVALAGADDNIESLLGWDLTSRTLWSAMDIEEQNDCLTLGLNYVNARNPELFRWEGRRQWTLDETMPDWAAVFLFATLAVHRPDLSTLVETATWVSWASAIAVVPTFLHREEWQRQVRDMATDPGRNAIDEAVLHQIERTDDTSFAYHPLADFSDPDLLHVVEQIARSANESQQRRDAAINILAEHAPAAALDVSRAALSDDDAPPNAIATIARLAPEATVAAWVSANCLGQFEYLRELNIDDLSDSSLEKLSSMLLDALPFDEHPDDPDDFSGRTPDAVARRMRMRLMQAMASRGMTASLVELEHKLPAIHHENLWHLQREARAREALAMWRPLPPRTLMNLVDNGDARLVRDSAGLLTLLLEQLDEIQHDLQSRSTFRSLWDGEPGVDGASPKSEDTISDWLADQLRLRLRPHIVVDREVQVRRNTDAGVGTRIDITVTSNGAHIGRVVFEAKHVDNRDLMTAIGSQLVGKYMDPAGLTHGIYIVYWSATKLRPAGWTKKHADIAVLANELREQTTHHLTRRQIEVFVLNIGNATA